MPKKHKQKALLTKPSSSAHSNLSLSKTLGTRDEPTLKTVNELIRDARQGNSNERPQTAQAASSLHPSVRAVLDVPVPLPPPPRCGLRGPVRLRRVPGPPPPRSWLTDSIHASREVKDVVWSRSHESMRIQQQSSILPGSSFPRNPSLLHYLMKAMATRWAWHVEYDNEYLAGLPTKVKETLLSYLAIYSDAQGPNPLRVLFPTHLEQNEIEEVTRLDLGCAIGGWTTTRKVGKDLEGSQGLHIAEQNTLSIEEDEIPDTWEENAIRGSSHIPTSVTVGALRFNNLKHLSLAVVPGTTKSSAASWTDLLNLASNLSTISSLSLAFWPQPTYTPNASASMARMTAAQPSTIPRSTYGGTNFYSSLDNDWREAAGILRKLSKSLYCLKWLDLTGCGEWFAALSWSQGETEEQSGSRATGPDWNGGWRGVENLILDVGWKPAPPSMKQSQAIHDIEQSNQITSETGDETQRRISGLLSQLEIVRLGSQSTHEAAQPEPWDVEAEREKYYHRLEVERHARIVSRAKEVADKIRAVRRAHGQRWMNVDFGSVENI